MVRDFDEGPQGVPYVYKNFFLPIFLRKGIHSDLDRSYGQVFFIWVESLFPGYQEQTCRVEKVGVVLEYLSSIFFNEEDKTKIFENGPYFFNFASLFLRP